MLLGNLGIHVNKCPTGVYTFVGSGIPAVLCYQGTEEEIRTALSSRYNGKTVKPRVFATKAEAWEAAEEFGISPCDIPTCLCNKEK